MSTIQGAPPPPRLHNHGQGAPPPPAAGPRPQTVSADVHDVNATGLGQHGKNQQGGSGRGDARGQENEPEATISGDVALLEATLNRENAFLTLQQALSHQNNVKQAQANGGLTSAHLTDIKRLLTRHMTPAQMAIMTPQQLQMATLTTLRSLRVQQHTAPEQTPLAYGVPVPTQDISGTTDDLFAKTQAQQASEPDRPRLKPALASPQFGLIDELKPENAQAQEYFTALISDPRAGYAPEGLAAWVTSRKQKIEFVRSFDLRSDYTDAATGIPWRIVVAEGAARLGIFKRFSASAGKNGSALILDYTRHINVDPVVAAAAREVVRTQKVRIVAATSPHITATSLG